MARDLAGDLISLMTSVRPYVRKRATLVMFVTAASIEAGGRGEGGGRQGTRGLACAFCFLHSRLINFPSPPPPTKKKSCSDACARLVSVYMCVSVCAGTSCFSSTPMRCVPHFRASRTNSRTRSPPCRCGEGEIVGGGNGERVCVSECVCACVRVCVCVRAFSQLVFCSSHDITDTCPPLPSSSSPSCPFLVLLPVPLLVLLLPSSLPQTIKQLPGCRCQRCV